MASWGPAGLLKAGHWPSEGSSDMSLVRMASSLATLQTTLPLEKSLERRKKNCLAIEKILNLQPFSDAVCICGGCGPHVKSHTTFSHEVPSS